MIAEPQTLDQRLRKRQRLCDDDDEAGPGQDQENIARAKPSTPKRQRLYPPSLPLGLERADFDALQDQAANVPLPQTPPDRPHNTSKKEEDEENWCSSDDSALVSMILHKLRLRQSDWDDCARRLGKGKGSIGERLKMLVGDGEVGLRRGKGRKKRGSELSFRSHHILIVTLLGVARHVSGALCSLDMSCDSFYYPEGAILTPRSSRCGEDGVWGATASGVSWMGNAQVAGARH